MIGAQGMGLSVERDFVGANQARQDEVGTGAKDVLDDVGEIHGAKRHEAFSDNHSGGSRDDLLRCDVAPWEQ